MSRLSLRNKFLFTLLMFIISNMVMMMGFFSFVFIPYVLKLDKSTREYFDSQIAHIKTDLNAAEDIQSFFDNMTRGNNTIVILKDQNEKVVYDNSNNHTALLSISELVEIDHQFYLITISNTKDLATGGVMFDLIIFQVIVFVIISVPYMFFSNQKFISPVDNIVKDMRDYKLGIKPKKREVLTGLDKVQNEFVDLAQTIEDEKAKQNRIIASISHDIKTPLTTIIGYTERLGKADLTQEAKQKYIDKIYDKSLVMKDIIESFDDYLSHNIENELKTEVIFVRDLLDKVQDGFKDDLKEKNIDFIIEANDLQEIIKIDPSKIIRVFSNVISNSVRHITKNGIIKVITKKENDKIVFTINDNGGGIKESIKDQIFEPLFTTDKSRKISGLGLSICKEIILMHGGAIEAYNENDGLTIKFIIPIYS